MRAPGACHPCAMRVCTESILCERSDQALRGLTASPCAQVAVSVVSASSNLGALVAVFDCLNMFASSLVFSQDTLCARHGSLLNRLTARAALRSSQASLCRQLQKCVKQLATAAQQRWLRQGLKARRRRRWRGGKKWKEQSGSGGGRWELG